MCMYRIKGTKWKIKKTVYYSLCIGRNKQSKENKVFERLSFVNINSENINSVNMYNG